MSHLKTKSIQYNFVMNYLLNISNILFYLLTFPYVSRVLQVESLGNVAFVTSVVTYFTMLAALGIPIYGIRACAQVRDDREQLTKTTHEILIIHAIITAFILVVYLISVATIPRLHEFSSLFYINAAGLILNVLGVNWFFQAIEQYDYITIRSLIFKAISLIMVFGLVKSPADYIVYGSITVFANIGSYLLNFIRLQKFITLRWLGNYEFKRHVRPVLTLFAQTVVVSLYTNLDTVMLGFLRDSYDVGLYNIAVNVKTVLLALVTSLGNVLMPRMSYYVKQENREAFLSTMLKALNFTSLLSFFVSTFFFLLSRESILFIAGDSYVGAKLTLQLMVIALVANGLTGVLGHQVLIPLGKEKENLISVSVAAVLNVVVNWCIIPQFGASGAAFATLLAELTVLVIQIYYTRDLLKEVWHGWQIRPYLVSSLFAMFSLLVVRQIKFPVFYTLLIGGSVSLIIYILLLKWQKEPLYTELESQIRLKLRKG